MRLTGSRTQAIPRHAKSRLEVALCLPNRAIFSNETGLTWLQGPEAFRQEAGGVELHQQRDGAVTRGRRHRREAPLAAGRPVHPDTNLEVLARQTAAVVSRVGQGEAVLRDHLPHGPDCLQLQCRVGVWGEDGAVFDPVRGSVRLSLVGFGCVEGVVEVGILVTVLVGNTALCCLNFFQKLVCQGALLFRAKLSQLRLQNSFVWNFAPARKNPRKCDVTR